MVSRHFVSFFDVLFFFFQAEDGIRDYKVTGVQTCALPISQTPNPKPQTPNPKPRTRKRGSGVQEDMGLDKMELG